MALTAARLWDAALTVAITLGLGLLLTAFLLAVSALVWVLAP